MMKTLELWIRKSRVVPDAGGLALACLIVVGWLPVSCSGPESGPEPQASSQAPSKVDVEAPSKVDVEAPSRVDVEKFAELVKAGEGVLLDVRTPEEFAAGHIPGATNLNVNDPEFRDKIVELDPEKTYLVYCRSGHRSQRACQIMSAAGFDQIHELAPGFNGWKSAGMPTEE